MSYETMPSVPFPLGYIFPARCRTRTCLKTRLLCAHCRLRLQVVQFRLDGRAHFFRSLEAAAWLLLQRLQDESRHAFWNGTVVLARVIWAILNMLQHNAGTTSSFKHRPSGKHPVQSCTERIQVAPFVQF